MKNFMDNKDFLLSTETGEKLFHNYAKDMPIVDCHCHISPKEIFENKRFSNITEVWLGGDHYKWRLMRANGVDERYITGDAPAREKFQKWAETLGRCVGNPVFEWSHLELKRFFGYEGVLNADTAQEVWDLANEKLVQDGFTCRELIKRSNVRMICTTDDPADSFEWHKKIAADDSFDVKVVPAMRPDAALRIERGQEFVGYMKRLSEVSGIETEKTFSGAVMSDMRPSFHGKFLTGRSCDDVYGASDGIVRKHGTAHSLLDLYGVCGIRKAHPVVPEHAP